MDTYQSADMFQYLKDNHFNVEILSVDRVNSDKVCLPYQYLKSTIYEGRILIPNRGTNLLVEELIGLKRNNNSGKVDHTTDGINSKDSADAVCGATYSASLHAAEYAYEYGEDLDVILDVDKAPSRHDQLIVDFENELRNINPLAQSLQQNHQLDAYSSDWLDIQDGIIII